MRYFKNRRLMLLHLVKPGAVCCEVGVLVGTYTRHVVDIGQPSRLYAIDHWAGDAVWPALLPGGVRHITPVEAEPIFLANFAYEIELGVVVQKKGDSKQMLSEIPDGSLDFCYVDASHFFESVLGDLEAALPKMKPGGILAGHDWCQIFQFGVPRAVAVFCDRHKQDLAFLTDEKFVPLKVKPPGRNWPDAIAYNSWGITVR